MRRTIKRTVDLSVQRSTVDYVDSTAFYYNDSAHDWVVKVFNDGSPAELTGTVKVYCQLPSGDWVNSGDAVIEGNVVTGILIRDCYLQLGQILCVMQYTEPIAGTEDNIRLTLDAFYTRVQRGYAGEDPITPSDKVIMWDDVEEKMQELTDAVNPITVSGLNPTITAESGKRYVCGEVQTLTLTPCATGICNVLFTSGTTAAILSIPNTVVWANGFDASVIEPNAIYEISIADGVYGVVSKWV